MKAEAPETGDLYRAYLTVSGDGIARFELDEPLRVDAPEDEQVDHIARYSRIAECNEIFARLYEETAEAMQGHRLAEFMPEDDPGRFRGFREFVRARYRLVQAEEAHTLKDTYVRWVSGSALGVVEGGRLRSYWLTLTDVTERKRAEADRERRGRILEAVAFGASRLVEPGPWRDRADEVLARLGQAAEAGRVTVGEAETDADGSTRIGMRVAWAAPGLEVPLDDPRVKGGFSPRDAGLGRLEAELRAGRPVITTVKGLAEAERLLPARMGSKSFAVVPIFANGAWWGFLGFGETRYVRHWLGPEVECLRAAAAVFGTAIERERAEAERDRRDRILEAVAFSAAQLLEPGTWQARAAFVLERLGQSADAAKVLLVHLRTEPDGSEVAIFRNGWHAPGAQSPLDNFPVKEGVQVQALGLGRIPDEMRAGRPVVSLVKDLPDPERAFCAGLGARSLASVPIFAGGQSWGLLSFVETRYEREWSAPEIEALKAAAAVFGAVIERETADAALRESEERFRRLASATFEGIAVTEDGVFLDANDQLASLLGCRVADLLGQAVEDFVPAEDHEIVRAQRRLGSEEPYEHSVLVRDGSVLPVEVRARQTPYQGRTVRVTAVRDLSSRKRAEERQRALETDLRQAAEQWRQTFDALDLGIVLADAGGQIVRLNRAALEEAKGAAFAHAVGRNLEDLKTCEPWGAALDLHLRVGQTRSSEAGEARDASSGRSFYLLASPWFRPDSEAPWRVVTFRDVTAFITLEKQLRRARTLEAMGSLVAGVAHEVRNPLFSISATVDALEAELGPRPEFAEYASLLRSQVGRLTQLMRDLLDFGKPSLLQRAPTRLPEVLRRAMRSCATLARDRRVAVEEVLEGEVPALDLDGSRVEQALENLLANAIQHAPAESVVRARMATIGHGPSRAVRLTVEDDGLGIPEADVARIFEPFFSRRKGGTGLGLSIVQRVAEAHGGSISAENRPGGGARFVLLLPVAGTREGSRG